MNNHKIKLIFSSLLLFYAFSYKTQINNGAIFEIIGGNVLKGELLSSDSTFKVQLVDNSIFDIRKSSVTQAYMPEQIILFPSGKYNLRKGPVIYFSQSFSPNHFGVDIFGGYQFGNGFEAGFGFGYHLNSLNLPVANSNFQWIDLNSYPIYLGGKYFIFKDKILKPYAKLNMGLNNNSPNWGVSLVKNGLMIESGFGLAFSGKKNLRAYFEINQYNSKARGTSVVENWDWNTNTLLSSTDVDFNVWFNKITFRLGLFFQIF